MNYIMLDTCVLLDISTNRKDLPIVSALEELTQSGVIKLLVTDLVITEFNRNKEDVADKTRKRLSQEFKIVKNIVSEFGGEQKEQAVAVLNEVNMKLPLLSEANYVTISRIEKLIEDSIQINVSDKVKIAAANRAINKKAPFHISKNSMADAVIIEQFSEFVLENQSENDAFFFITHNHNDFSAKDHRLPHEDFNDIFQENNVAYFNNTQSVINIIDADILEDIEFEENYMDETRGLQEILLSMDELVDKVWYNRHCNRCCQIKNGEIRMAPRGTKEYGNDVMHEDIWEGALKSAKRVEAKYEDTGPWSVFEWGMINGKLSALRWVLGEDWDELYT